MSTIKKFYQFICESNIENDIDLLEEAFLSFCDKYNLEFFCKEQVFVNGSPFPKDMLNRIPPEIDIKAGYRIDFTKRDMKYANVDGYVSKFDFELFKDCNIENVRNKFKKCISLFNKLTNNIYTIDCNINNITDKSWSIILDLFPNIN